MSLYFIGVVTLTFFFNFIGNIMFCWFYVSFVVFSSFDRMYYLLALFCSFCIIGFCSSYIYLRCFVDFKFQQLCSVDITFHWYCFVEFLFHW